MKRISIYNSFIKDNQQKRELISNKLKQNGFQTGGNGELLIVIGGDGTFLSAIRKRMYQNPIFVGFNAGNLGFLSEFTMDKLEDFIRVLKKSDYWVEEHPVYEVHYKDKDKQKVEYFINDLVVERKSTRILHMGVQVDDELLCSISGDGMIMSSALGSTGYSMSAGGAISVGCKDMIQVTPVATVHSKAYHTLPNSMLLPDENNFTIFPNIKKQRSFRMVCDGKEIRCRNSRFIEVKKSDKKIRILRSKQYNSIKHIKNKIIDLE